MQPPPSAPALLSQSSCWNNTEGRFSQEAESSSSTCVGRWFLNWGSCDPKCLTNTDYCITPHIISLINAQNFHLLDETKASKFEGIHGNVTLLFTAELLKRWYVGVFCSTLPSLSCCCCCRLTRLPQTNPLMHQLVTPALVLKRHTNMEWDVQGDGGCL